MARRRARGRRRATTIASFITLIALTIIAVLINPNLARDIETNLPTTTSSGAPNTSDVAGNARAIDGDTIEISGQRIRFSGIDAPERAQVCGSEHPGSQARLALARMIEGRTVECSESGSDRYGRTLAECRAGGVNLSSRMVSDGWAWDYAQYSNGRYAGEERQARAAGRGVWSMDCQRPSEWRRTNS